MFVLSKIHKDLYVHKLYYVYNQVGFLVQKVSFVSIL